MTDPDERQRAENIEEFLRKFPKSRDVTVPGRVVGITGLYKPPRQDPPEVSDDTSDENTGTLNSSGPEVDR